VPTYLSCQKYDFRYISSHFSCLNIHNEFTPRDPSTLPLTLTKDRNAICTLILERIWFADGHANKEQSIGPMMYSTAYKKIKTIFLNHHAAAFEDEFDKYLELVGGFDRVERINVTGGNRMSGKTMVGRVVVEMSVGVAEGLRG
jgi:hypothetical protein